MTDRAQALLREALALPLEERANVAAELLASLDGAETDVADVEAAWAAEIEKRARQCSLAIRWVILGKTSDGAPGPTYANTSHREFPSGSCAHGQADASAESERRDRTSTSILRNPAGSKVSGCPLLCGRARASRAAFFRCLCVFLMTQASAQRPALTSGRYHDASAVWCSACWAAWTTRLRLPRQGDDSPRTKTSLLPLPFDQRNLRKTLACSVVEDMRSVLRHHRFRLPNQPAPAHPPTQTDWVDTRMGCPCCSRCGIHRLRCRLQRTAVRMSGLDTVCFFSSV